jgi:hypothetical protein
VRYQQGGVQAAYSDAVFDRKEAELASKLSGAYFEALLAIEKMDTDRCRNCRLWRSASLPSGVAVAKGR